MLSRYLWVTRQILGFDSCDQPSNLTQIGYLWVKNGEFCSRVTFTFNEWPKNNRTPLLYYVKLCLSFWSHRWIQTWVTVRKHSNRVKSSDFFVPCDLEIWWMTLKSNRAPRLCCFKRCALFHSHQCIETGVTVHKRPICVKIELYNCVTLKFDGWHWQTIGHLP